MNGSLNPFSCLWSDASSATSLTRALPAKARCVVIGAGYTGLSSALELSRRAGATAGEGIVVIDAMAVGEGASGRNGGQVIPGLKLNPEQLVQRFGDKRGPALVEAVGGAAGHVFELIKRLNIDCEARQDGWLQAAHNGASLFDLEQRAAQWRGLGADVRILDGAQTAAALGTSIYQGALLDLRAGQLNPYRYAQGLAAAARAQGVDIFECTPALELKRRNGRWVVVTDKGEIEAGQVVIATNAYSSPLLRALPHTYVTLWSLQAATAPLSRDLDPQILPGGLPVSDTFRVLRYFRRSADGRFILGTRGAFRDQLGPVDLARVRQEMLHIYPALEAVPLTHCWTGRVAVPAASIPLLSQPEPGLTVALGYYGRGVAMATRMGSFVADLVQGVPASEIVYPVTPFKAMPVAPLHRTVAQITANVMRVRDLIERRARGGRS
ncbi:FAD-dependent oxidoreductase [Pseudomonas gingeri]|uniref:FAD-binding oxidoreductase n=1 Tax=Pseudomonas gingeri TaxID=117681 RepID=A0A7Y8CGU0_9PSED|nr:FAD-binding oxidoreductase [Pseudomonas gingeri]NWE46234.1 FAD-binding oxidoreductase [Pseudomonas gingeri]